MSVDPYLGEIFITALDYAPSEFLMCNGQTIPSASYMPLYALIGTTYGGNSTNFALPDLRGRVPMGAGTGTGLTARTLAGKVGAETVTLSTANLPAHNHGLNAVSDAGTTSAPSGAYIANTGTLDKEFKTTGTTVAMNTSSIGNTGSGTAVAIVQPSLVLNFMICVQGAFPSRP